MLLLPLLACVDTPARTLVEATGTPSDAAVVWNGFSQVWGYNHRLNSFGDVVGPVTCDDAGCAAAVTHAAASGSGSDTAAWSSAHTTVRAPGVTFLGGTTRIAIDEEGAEGRLVPFTADVVLPDAPVGEELHALLNGFDLQAVGDPDKLVHLSVRVGAPVFEGNAVRIPIDGALQLDCDSVECDTADLFDASVHYELLVGWLLVAADDADLAVTPAVASHAYSWLNRSLADELDLAALAVTESVRGEPGFGAAFVGVTGLAVDLDEEHHMAEWSTGVATAAYDADAGTADLTANLAFKQWNAGTWWNPVSYTARGSGAIELEVALVQLRDACVRTGSVSGSIAWQADGRPADDAAVQARTVAVEACA